MPTIPGRTTHQKLRMQTKDGFGEWPSSFWFTTDYHTGRLYLGHVIDVLSALPAKSVQCCVTSPPYWGLRSYLDKDHASKRYEIGSEPSPDCGTHGQAQCGACFVCTMVAVFRGVRKVLRDDGTCWLNLGDSYGNTNILPTGNLVGVPWRVAFALQHDGWVLRQDIIWAKPSPMPESIKNRCTKAHEYIFLLAKSQRYYYDAEAIKEDSSSGRTAPFSTKYTTETALNGRKPCENQGNGLVSPFTGLSNKRSVWRVAGSNYPGAHFAVYPSKLIEPCILAGTSAKGCCARCGAPWQRVVEETKLRRERPNEYTKRTGGEGTGNHCNNTVAGVQVKTLGWKSSCNCVGEREPVPCTVLDPFVGSGTTVCVALKHGRRGVGIDLSKQYLEECAVPRIEGTLRELGKYKLTQLSLAKKPLVQLNGIKIFS